MHRRIRANRSVPLPGLLSSQSRQVQYKSVHVEWSKPGLSLRRRDKKSNPTNHQITTTTNSRTGRPLSGERVAASGRNSGFGRRIAKMSGRLDSNCASTTDWASRWTCRATLGQCSKLSPAPYNNDRLVEKSIFKRPFWLKTRTWPISKNYCSLYLAFGNENYLSSFSKSPIFGSFSSFDPEKLQ